MRLFKLLLFSGLILFIGCEKENDSQTAEYTSVVGDWTLVRFDQTQYVNGSILSENSICRWYPGTFSFDKDMNATLILNNVTYRYTVKMSDDCISFHETSTGKDVSYRFRVKNANKMVIDHAEGGINNEKVTSMILEKQKP